MSELTAVERSPENKFILLSIQVIKYKKHERFSHERLSDGTGGIKPNNLGCSEACSNVPSLESVFTVQA